MNERKQHTKFELDKALYGKDVMPQHWYDSKGQKYFGLLQSVQREDGTGSSFNVTIVGQGTATFHLRTID